MRILALDYGSARCGCAVSDVSGIIARPLEAIETPASETGIAGIAALVDGLGVDLIVVGLPITLSGEEGRQAAEARKFAERLREHVPVSVETYDERFTTSLAKQTRKSSARAGAPVGGSEDSIAAAHLLTGYLRQREA